MNQPQPAPGQRGGPPVPPTGRPRRRGLVVALVVVGAVVAVLGIGAAVLAFTPLGTALDRQVGNGCRIVDDRDVDEIVGGDFGMERLDAEEIARQPVDIGVIEGSEVCWAMDTDFGDEDIVRHVTVTTLTSGAADTLFAAELADARAGAADPKGRSRDRPYLNQEIDQAGDEAFCTTTTWYGSSGILVRRGDTLTYVSVSLDQGGDDWADAGSDEPLRSNDEDQSCAAAQRLEERVRRP